MNLAPLHELMSYQLERGRHELATERASIRTERANARTERLEAAAERKKLVQAERDLELHRQGRALPDNMKSQCRLLRRLSRRMASGALEATMGRLRGRG